MADYDNFTTMRALMGGLAKAMNLVNPEIEHHHEQTAYLTLFIAREMGMPEKDVALALYSALLHDIGSIVTEAPQSLADVERNAREVSLKGAYMLADLPGFGDIANVISFSQCSWKESVAAAIEYGETCERLGQIASVIHLADTVSTLIRPNVNVLNQVSTICGLMKRNTGTQFSPEAVEAFLRVADAEYVWMDLAHNPLFLTFFTGEIASVSLEDAVQLTELMSRIIDYRSPFTAMHSAGVAASARTLAELSGMSAPEILQMEIAGNLHDIGKLAVPRTILEKPGKLTSFEFNVMKEHPYYTALVLHDIEGFEVISHWAARHHEKLDGRGYPFHFGAADLDCGDRIMAVADIFSAITEERPYRAGMTREQATDVLMEDVLAKKICDELVMLLLDNYELVNQAREQASRAAGKRYFDSLGRNAA